MPIDPTALANLLSLYKPAVCAMWKVIWDPLDDTETRYYSDAAYHSLPPFTGVGVVIMPKIIGSVVKDASFEICPDLKTEKINITFDNIIQKSNGAQIEPEENIQNRFLRFKSGVRCELIFYYPNPGSTPITTTVWFGVLQAPEIYGYKQVRTTATNGYRSREQKIPRRMRPRECTANFGAWMPDTFALETNGCPYDRHLGGSMGTLNPDTSQPWLDCPRDSTATCNTRLGTTDGRYFLGFDTTASPAFGNQSRGEIFVSKGNQSALKEPIRVIAGTKYVRGLQVLAFRRERDNNHPVNSWMSGVLEVGEGPNESITGVKVKEKLIGANDMNIRLGDRGQPRSNYASNFTNLSGTGHIYARYGWIDLTDPTSVGPADFEGECKVKGFNKAAIFTDASTYSRAWTDNRIWFLLEMMTNQRWGMAYSKSKIEIADWIDRAAWGDQYVTFSALFLDGEEVVYAGRRTRFDAILEGRPIAEQIEDLCRSGALSVPFQHNGKFTLRSFEAMTEDELDNIRTFTDVGGNRNIVWADGQPAITLSQTPDDKVVNEVVVTFEEDSNTDIARPVTVDDPNQKLKAGRALGENNLQPVPKNFSAFGITSAQEAIRLAHRILRFGEFDEGGTQNNLRATFTTPFEQTLGVKRYDFIRIESSLLDPFDIGTGDYTTEEVNVFRVLRMKKLSNGLVEMTCQAYNELAYEAMDVIDLLGGISRAMTIDSAGSEFINGNAFLTQLVNDRPMFVGHGTVTQWTGTAWEISVNNVVYYTSPDDVAVPWSATFVPTGPGLAPAPTITEGVIIDPPGCLLTLDPPSYSGGILTISVPPC